MDSARTQFLAGDRPDDVLLFIAESAVSDLGTLAQHGEQVERGVVLILEAERGRSAFEGATGVDPMTLASSAMNSEGDLDLDAFEGECPEADANGEDSADEADDAATEEHAPRFVFGFAEERNEEAGGIYAEGDVIHAYAVCECGTAYSDRWVAGE
ncbi:DUF5807 family protein [Halococcus saccharolyticus]|uniref:Uncharacterized protein n=1 Tax=Halococcus saccharolyticus DSM 5350 TaxID=1227455 RepID=M0MFM7_9EURY|nr:DUF5807 family protein [Halococcus saccharolyticus]EMA43240.1 hypothetical protein C449_14717 [Halococcus saccharolyticus DSM 5350]